LTSYTKGKTQIEGVREQGAEEEILTQDGGSSGKLEKTAE
jgi:hypothetical protein